MTANSTAYITPRYLTYEQAAIYTGVSRWTIYRAVKQGDLPVRYAQSRPVFDRYELDEYLRRER